MTTNMYPHVRLTIEQERERIAFSLRTIMTDHGQRKLFKQDKFLVDLLRQALERVEQV